MARNLHCVILYKLKQALRRSHRQSQVLLLQQVNQEATAHYTRHLNVSTSQSHLHVMKHVAKSTGCHAQYVPSAYCVLLCSIPTHLLLMITQRSVKTTAFAIPLRSSRAWRSGSLPWGAPSAAGAPQRQVSSLRKGSLERRGPGTAVGSR